MPSISEILDSISVSSLIKDDIIKNGEFKKTNRGVIYYTGGFTVVFPVDVNGHKWAFRCWHTEIGNVRKRFKIISDYVNRLRSDYFCNLYYCDSGLVVDGKVFPTTRMDWVEGEPINQYIVRNLYNKEHLLSLADEFLRMVEFLHTNHIAHGDLQHGNIIVTNSGRIKLVDYDSLFVPGLEGQPDIILGKAEFQHPKRGQLKITSEKLDYFSELVIYLSIIAIANQPSIIQNYIIDDSLLFQSSDWADFENSAIYKTLKAIGNKDILLLLDILVSYLRETDINNLIPFPVLWRNMLKEPVIHSFICGDVDGIVFRGQETLITWSAENVDKVELNSVELSYDQREQKMTFTNDTDIILTISNGLHRIELKKHIKVIDPPVIEFSVEKNKLMRKKGDIESTKLKWSVSKANSVILRCEDNILSTSKISSGFPINPATDTIYELIAIGLNNKTEFRSSIKVLVRNPAKINFQSDKLFTLPGVPITISWVITHAKSAKLNGKDIPLKGKTNFFQDTDEKYSLLVKDDFGETRETINVRMLPLPVVRSVLVGMPNINQMINIQCKTPNFEGISTLPMVNTDFIRLDIPAILDLKDEGLFVELKSTPQLKLTKRISQFIKNIVNNTFKYGNK